MTEATMLTETTQTSTTTTRPRRTARRAVRPGTVIALAILAIVALWAVLPSVCAPYDPLASNTSEILVAPSFAHLFGTDDLGRDIFSRVVYGTRVSLLTAALALGVALVFGLLLGLAAGFARASGRAVLTLLIDVLLAIPGLVLAMAIITALGSGSLQLGLAVGVALVGLIARVMRSEVLRTRHETFIEASRVAGASPWDIAARRVLPNALGPVLVLAVLEYGQVILIVAALSFLGFGAPPPAPEWGTIVSQGRDFLVQAWWVSALPGLVIAAVVIALNRVSQALAGREVSR
ncbi:ABC transporter permease [Microbacterium sp. E-13]|uniref:ABC transporter permease n=1 Tax=Microbacterium sp. E-13 TaxID=3404048 RepID=UPI003CF60EB2